MTTPIIGDHVSASAVRARTDSFTDQYRDRVPDDLILLPSASEAKNYLSEFELNEILQADWYEIHLIGRPMLAVSARATSLDTEDAITNHFTNKELHAADFIKVNAPLKRYSEEDGFYHA